jgi:hypothetical protein
MKLRTEEVAGKPTELKTGYAPVSVDSATTELTCQILRIRMMNGDYEGTAQTRSLPTSEV